MSELSHVPSLEQLRCLATVAAHGSMGAAAMHLGISQQATSARVSAAETLIGFAVFERSTRGVRPTGRGQLVLAWGQRVLDAANELEEGVQGVRAGGHQLVVAASNTISEALLPHWASELRQTNPGIALQVAPGNSENVLEAVSTGRVDLGFVETPIVMRGVRSKVVAHDELIVVVPPDHPWSRRPGRTDRAELSAAPLILREVGSGTRSRFEQALPDHAPPLQTLQSTPAVRDAVRATGAATVLSSLAVQAEIASGRLVRIPVHDLTMPRVLRAVWNPNQRPRGAAAALLRIALSSPSSHGAVDKK